MDDGLNSMAAEIQALEMAVEALYRLSAGHCDFCPHSYDKEIFVAELNESE